MRKNRSFVRFLVSALFILQAFSLSGLTIKLATLTPAGSVWDEALKNIGAEWARISNGSISFKIYSGGVAGDEGDMLRKIRIGQLDAAVLSGMGFAKMHPELFILNLPFFYRSDEELLYVLDRMKGKLEGFIGDKGFNVVAWQLAGWIYFFSKDKVVYPQDLMTHKVSVTADAPEISAIWKTMGFSIVPLSTIDLMSGLQSGMVNAFYSLPMMSAAYQWFGLAKNMCSIKLAPLVGGLIIGDRAWNQIPDELKPELIKAADRILTPLYADTLRVDAEAIEVMKKYGLVVNEVPPAAMDEWRRLGEKGYGEIVGRTISVGIYNEVRGLLEQYRRGK